MRCSGLATRLRLWLGGCSPLSFALGGKKIIDIFSTPYEVWSTREATRDEMLKIFKEKGYFLSVVRDRLIEVIDTPLKAAKYIAKVSIDDELERFIDEMLEHSDAYKLMRQKMPSKTPKGLADYQKRYSKCDFREVDQAINSYGDLLAEGQYLFHGGLWPDHMGTQFTTTRPLSTTFSPQVALQNAEFYGKAYDANRIDLFVLYVKNPKTKVFVFRRKGTMLGHEKEVLFASGATLVLKNRYLIRNDYSICKCIDGIRTVKKEVPIYVLEVEIS